ncbi:hypothetical protein [Clostridium rectalis]|uniref:hypothetical protein n=1 Tax=Clostridium rectalis TaxID=2040295 RepID=UPI000F62F5B9|nr:hypothetical protein [Clostridium rectalis]
MKDNFRNIGFIFIIVVIGVFSMPGKIYANSVDIKVNAYLNGKLKLGYINPIEVTVESSMENLEGSLNLYLGEERYAHPINIVGKNTKTYLFSVPLNKSIKKIKVDLVQQGETIKEKQFPIEVCNSKTLFIGLLSDSENKYSFLKNIRMNPLDIKNVEIVNLKDKNLALDYTKNLGIIFIDDFNSESLTTEQQESIDKWINVGGIVFVGNDKYKVKNLTGIFENVKDITKVGEGNIIPIDFDLGDKNNISKLNKKIMENINTNLLCNITQNINLKDEAVKSEKLKSCANNMLKINRNVIYFLISVITIYLIILFYFLIKRKNKFFLWGITIAAFSLITFLIYFIEDVGKEKITLASLNEYKGNRCITNSLINVYPYKKDLNIFADNSLFISQQGTGKYNIDPLAKSILVESSSITNYLYNVRISNIKNNNKNTLILKDQRIEGKITNVFPYKLEDCILIVGDTAIKIGSLSEKENIKIDYKLDHNLKDNGDYEYLNNLEKLLSNKYNKEFVKYYFNLDTYTNLECKLVAFNKRKTILNVNNKKRKINTINMEIIPIDIKFHKKEFKLSGNIIRPIVEKELNDKELGIKEYTFKKDESVKIYYLIPKNINPKKIKINNTFEDGNFYLEIFNSNKNEWEKIDKLHFESSKYIKDNKLFALRVKGNGRFVIPSITLDGITN